MKTRLTKADREYWTREKEARELEKVFGPKFDKMFDEALKKGK